MKTERGRVLRDTAGGEGLLSIGGTQYPFRLEGMWRSDLAPKANMAVDVDFDDGGVIAAIRAVDPTAAAREQAAKLAAQAGVAAKQAGKVAKQAASEFASEFKAKGLPAVTAYAQVIGVKTLVAMALLLVGWFFLSSASVDLFGDKASATFYDFMRVLNNPQNGFATIARQSRAGAGFYGFLTIVVLLAPLLPHLLKSRGTWLAYCAPAAWMLLAVLVGTWKINSSISEAQRQFGGFGGELNGMAKEFMNEVLKAVSLGFGLYLSIAAAGYLAYVGVKRYRAPAGLPD